ncbi:MAG: transporter substrate-binding domain-containing protein [Verrucomicrobiota bacterium]|nr:transporter substrate-binding domain-containing protein [Verrucomicrobiota bacterium]
MKKYLFTLLLSVQLFGSSKTELLIVGTTSGYAPYVSLDAKGNYEGFDVDFASELAKKLNRKLVLKDCGSMPSLMLALQQKKVDVLIWAISITDERSKKMDMVYYQGQKVTEMPFLFWKKIPEGISVMGDLGKESKWTVSVEAGSFQENVLKQWPQVSLKQVDKITDAVMEIRFGKSIAAMADPSLISELTAAYPEIKVLNLPLKPKDYSLGNGICINKATPELTIQVQKATEELIREGKVAELEKKWNLTPGES